MASFTFPETFLALNVLKLLSNAALISPEADSISALSAIIFISIRPDTVLALIVRDTTEPTVILPEVERKFPSSHSILSILLFPDIECVLNIPPAATFPISIPPEVVCNPTLSPVIESAAIFPETLLISSCPSQLPGT